MEAADINNRFEFHPADEEKAANHECVRQMCCELAHSLNELLPEGREKSLAITNLEETMMWANAALARHQGD
jgi:hypothetical protein